MTEEFPPLPRFPPAARGALAGAVWGAAGYMVLWGLSPVVVTRQFVVSIPGLLLLLPVRLVLCGLRAAEALAGRSFHFPDSNWWIGVVAALTGAAIAVPLVLLARRVVRLARA